MCMCACCMRRLVPCPSRPLTSSLLASICTYSSLEPVASGPQAALRHTRHARRQRRFARRDGEVAVLGQHIALPITSKTCPGIPPSIRRFPPVMVFLVSLTHSSSLSLLLYIIRFELVLPAPLLILLPFQEVAPSAAHQSVRHTLQLQGAPCRRTRSQGGLQGELQSGNYRGGVAKHKSEFRYRFCVAGKSIVQSQLPPFVQGINMLGA